MKNLLRMILLLAIVSACSETSDGFTLNADLRGDVANGTQVYLKKTNKEGRPVDVDTTSVENGLFAFAGAAASPELHYIFIDQLKGNIPVVIEQGTITISVQKDSLAYADLKGTTQNELFADFLSTSRALSERAISMSNDMRMASMDRDSAAGASTMASLRDEYAELQDEAKSLELNFARENPNALISALIIDKILTTGVLPEKEVKEMYEALSQEIKETSVGKKLKEKLEKTVALSIGSKAPNFSAPTPTGEELALNDVLGKATILDFWAAWCRPCRAENPNVVRVYDKYREKGLSILGVSLDRKAEDWKKAIKDDGLDWNHVSNVQYFDAIAKLYNVDAIPATFILDENGIIVAKNLRGQALEKKISEMLQ